MKELVIERKTRWTGLGAAAKRLGCTRTHISMCLNGKRSSAALKQRMKKMGVTVRDCTAAK